MTLLTDLFSLDGQVAIVTGGTGVLGMAVLADVLQKEQLEAARDTVLERWGRIDILVNAAGGNVPAATLTEGTTVFDLPMDAFRQVFELNLLGTLLPSQVFGAAMAQRRPADQRQPARGGIVNISS